MNIIEDGIKKIYSIQMNTDQGTLVFSDIKNISITEKTYIEFNKKETNIDIDFDYDTKAIIK